MGKSKITIEDLARMVKKGFEQTATKDDLRKVWSVINDVNEGLGRVQDDGRDTKVTLVPSVRSMNAMEEDIRNLNSRVTRLERKTRVGK